MHRTSIAFTIVAALAPFLPQAGAAQASETFRLSGDRAAIYDLAGEVQVEPGTGSDIVVEVRRGGADERRLRVDRRQVDGRSSLVVVFPGDDVIYSRGRWNGSTHMRVREDGTFSGPGSGSTRRVRIRSSGSGMEAYADLTVRVPAGKSVSLYLGVGRVDVRNVSGDVLVDVASAAVSAQNTRGLLDIDTGSGSVAVDGAEGHVRIDTGSGSVRVNDVRGPRLTVDTGSGSVTGSRISAAQLHVDTGSGRIELTDVRANTARLDTGSGSVRLGLLEAAEHIRIDTGSGSVRLDVPESMNAALEIETGSGGIDVSLPVRVVRSRRGEFSGVLGSGGGRIEIDTGSGGVRVRGF